MQGTQERQTLSLWFLQNLGDFSFPFMTLRPVMENFIKYFMPEMMTTKTGPQCKNRLERDVPSNTFCHGHLYVYNLIRDGKGTKLSCENL